MGLCVMKLFRKSSSVVPCGRGEVSPPPLNFWGNRDGRGAQKLAQHGQRMAQQSWLYVCDDVGDVGIDGGDGGGAVAVDDDHQGHHPDAKDTGQ